MNTNAFSAQAEGAAELIRAMGNPRRLLVLCHLAEAGELSVGDLAGRVGLSQSALSQHLAKLRDRGLVATRREAQTIHYRVADRRAERLLLFLQEMFCPDLGGEMDVRTSHNG